MDVILFTATIGLVMVVGTLFIGMVFEGDYENVLVVALLLGVVSLMIIAMVASDKSHNNQVTSSPNVTVTIDGKQYVPPVQSQQIEVTIDGKTYQLSVK